MLLLQVQDGNNIIDKLLRKEVLFTGFRIIKTADLQKVFGKKLTGYQLEAAINQYMFENRKRVFYLKTNILNVHKSNKWGFINGYLSSFSMEFSIFSYLGIKKYLSQVLYFGKNELILFKDHKN